jgi:hypothetical protein
MKGRPFLAVVLALVLLLSGLGLGGWWLVLQRSPLQLQHRALQVPVAARFVPRQAPLSLYLASDGQEPLAYARAVAPAGRRREAVAAVARLRDGAFAAAGLDYNDELASWLAPGIGLALFDATPATAATASARPEPGAAAGPGWLLVLRSRDDLGARRFLQRFWQSRSLAGTDLLVSTYRGMGLISGRGALVGHEPLPLATALVADDLVLIASGRGVLEQALDVSQIEELNQAGLPDLAPRLERLGEGAALLLARPAALHAWFGLPPAAADGPEPARLLLAAISPERRGLRLEALIEGNPLAAAAAGSAPAAGADPLPALLAGLQGTPDSLMLLRDPRALRQLPLVGPLLAAMPPLRPEAGPLPALVAAADSGALLLADGPGGWLLGSTADQPGPASLEAPLAAEGLIPAPLELQGRSLLVWTRLQASGTRPAARADGEAQLQASVAGWRAEADGLAWWGRNLALLEARAGGGQRLHQQLDDLAGGPAPLQWAMEQQPAQALLRPWRPWRLLSALAGGDLDAPVQGLALSAGPQGTDLRLRARLQLG